jgi:hypothetical protein
MPLTRVVARIHASICASFPNSHAKRLTPVVRRSACWGLAGDLLNEPVETLVGLPFFADAAETARNRPMTGFSPTIVPA